MRKTVGDCTLKELKSICASSVCREGGCPLRHGRDRARCGGTLVDELLEEYGREEAEVEPPAEPDACLRP